jgi:hypothetical protein
VAAYPEILFNYGIEERAANVGYSGMLQCLNVVEMILAEFSPSGSPEK